MLTVVSLIIFVACVKLLSAGGSPALCASLFAVSKLVFAFLLGGGVVSVVIVAAITGLLAFGYFWLLDRVEGSGLWWAVLIGGVVLLA